MYHIGRMVKRFIIDSERSDECIGLIMMCVFFKFLNFVSVCRIMIRYLISVSFR